MSWIHFNRRDEKPYNNLTVGHFCVVYELSSIRWLRLRRRQKCRESHKKDGMHAFTHIKLVGRWRQNKFPFIENFTLLFMPVLDFILNIHRFEWHGRSDAHTSTRTLKLRRSEM